MLRFLNIFIFCLLAGANVVKAEIVKTGDIKAIEKIFKSADEGTLIVFDVADVLITSEDRILKAHNKKYKKELKKQLENDLGKEEAQMLFSRLNKQRKNKVVDPEMPRILSEIQSNNVRILGLTNCYTGKLGVIESLEDWRIDELNLKGYDFEKSWKDVETKTFSNLKSPSKKASYSVFKKGIIFTSRVSKDLALEAFLNYSKFKPKQIIFIDNKLKNITVVQEYADKHKIPYVGIEYTAVIDEKLEPLNKARADLQFKTLREEKKWLSDIEADEVIKSQREADAKRSG